MSRPGFVLEVDERTPSLLVPDGDRFRLERFPLGTRVIYPADSLPQVPDLGEAISAALDAPIEPENAATRYPRQSDRGRTDPRRRGGRGRCRAGERKRTEPTDDGS